ncbi:MAG: hypothetical protein ACX93I_10935 [Winogradskyella sp.]
MTTVQIQLRKAEPEDLKLPDDTLKVGQPFWYKSLKDGTFDNKAYVMSYKMDLQEFSWQLQHGMIWVPVSDIWLNKYQGKNFGD